MKTMLPEIFSGSVDTDGTHADILLTAGAASKPGEPLRYDEEFEGKHPRGGGGRFQPADFDHYMDVRKRNESMRLPRATDSDFDRAAHEPRPWDEKRTNRAKKFFNRDNVHLVDMPSHWMAVSERDIADDRQQRLDDIGGTDDPIMAAIDHKGGDHIYTVDDGNNRVHWAQKNGQESVPAFIHGDQEDIGQLKQRIADYLAGNDRIPPTTHSEKGEPLRYDEQGMQPGDTKSENGVTYVLNQNHRWTRQDDEPFSLAVQPAVLPKKATFDDQGGQQGGLFETGGLAGQMDLFKRPGTPDDLVQKGAGGGIIAEPNEQPNATNELNSPSPDDESSSDAPRDEQPNEQKLRSQVQDNTHTMGSVVSGQFPVGVGSAPKDSNRAKQHGLQAITVNNHVVYGKDENQGKIMEVAGLLEDGKYGTTEFSRALGYTDEEIDTYKEFLAATGKEHLINDEAHYSPGSQINLPNNAITAYGDNGVDLTYLGEKDGHAYLEWSSKTSPKGFQIVKGGSANDAVVGNPETWGRAIKMPEESLKGFVNDMQGVIEIQPSKHPEIQAVSRGDSELLGKGHEAVAWKVGDKIVKKGTTAPFDALGGGSTGQGHRTPQEAMDSIGSDLANTRRMLKEGIPGIQTMTTSVEKGANGAPDAAFSITDALDIDTRMTRAQLDQVRDSIRALHKNGWTLNDKLQVGLGKDGKPYHFDIGLASKEGSEYDRADDLTYLRMVYQDHGEDLLPWGEQAENTFNEFQFVVNDFGGHVESDKMLVDDAKSANRARKGIIDDDPSRAAELNKSFSDALIKSGLDPLDYLEKSEFSTGPKVQKSLFRRCRIAKIRYEKESAGGGWMSLGGAPVFVGESGKIEMGCPGLRGETLSSLDDDPGARAKRQKEAEQAGWESQETKDARDTHEEAKEKLKDFVVLTRLGDKIYVFGGDAAVLNDLTQVGDGETANFDTEDLDHHMGRLVDAGHRVAIVDRTEEGDPDLDSELDGEAEEIKEESDEKKEPEILTDPDGLKELSPDAPSNEPWEGSADDLAEEPEELEPDEFGEFIEVDPKVNGDNTGGGRAGSVSEGRVSAAGSPVAPVADPATEGIEASSSAASPTEDHLLPSTEVTTEQVVSQLADILKEDLPPEAHAQVDQAAAAALKSGEPFDLYQAITSGPHPTSRAARHKMVGILAEHDNAEGTLAPTVERPGQLPGNGLDRGGTGLAQGGTSAESESPGDVGPNEQQSLQDKHTLAAGHIEHAPTSVKGILQSLHGLRSAKNKGVVQTTQLGHEYAREIYDHLRSEKESADFGDLHDLSRTLGHGAIGYESPGGNIVMVPPKFKTDDWDVRYSVPRNDVEAAEPPPQEQAPAAPVAPSKPRGVNPKSHFGKAIIEALGPKSPDMSEDDYREMQEQFKETAESIFKQKEAAATLRASGINDVIGQYFSSEPVIGVNPETGKKTRGASPRQRFLGSLHAYRGKDYSAFQRNSNFGKTFDDMADAAALHYPDILDWDIGASAKKGDAAAALWDTLQNNVMQELKPWHDEVIDETLKQFSHMEQEPDEKAQELIEAMQSEEFARRGAKIRYRKWARGKLSRYRAASHDGGAMDVANATSRSGGAVGPNAKVPKIASKLASKLGKRATVLDFGAGKEGIHAKGMAAKGINVTAYDFGDNQNRGIHDPKALDRQYCIVYASNVLNVQDSISELRKTIKEIADSTESNGFVVANLPASPRKGVFDGMTAEQGTNMVRKLLEKAVGKCEVLEGGNTSPIFQCQKSSPIKNRKAGHALYYYMKRSGRSHGDSLRMLRYARQLSLFGDAPTGPPADWEETKHPRGGGGQFATSSSATAPPAAPPVEKTPAAPEKEPSPEKASNEDLVMRIKSGDQSAQDQLLQQNGGLLRNIATRFSRNESDRQDLQQEAAIAMLRAVDKFDPEKGKKFSTFAAYQIQAYVHRAAQKLRRGGMANVPEDEDFSGIAQEAAEVPMNPVDERMRPASDLAGTDEMVDRLQELVTELPDRDRDILSMRFEQGLSFKEIGEKYGISKQAAQKAAAKSMKILQANIGGGQYAKDGDQLIQYANQLMFDFPEHNPGDTKTENGITYVLNQNHRWERKDKTTSDPDLATTPQSDTSSVSEALEPNRATTLQPPDKTTSETGQPTPEMAAQDWQENGVRAKAFKSWFGDWETDPENSSKVVDPETGSPQEQHETSAVINEDGQPVRVYHGTAKGGWGTFDKSKLDNAENLLYGDGFYFTEDLELAKTYKNKGAKPVFNGDTAGLAEAVDTHLDWLRAQSEAPRMIRNFEYAAERLQGGDSAWLDDEDSAARNHLKMWLPAHLTEKYWQQDQSTAEVKDVFLNIRNPYDAETGAQVMHLLPEDAQTRIKEQQKTLIESKRGHQVKAGETAAYNRDEVKNYARIAAEGGFKVPDWKQFKEAARQAEHEANISPSNLGQLTPEQRTQYAGLTGSQKSAVNEWVESNEKAAASQTLSNAFGAEVEGLRAGNVHYEQLRGALGGKGNTNAWLAKNGFDGITHIGGQVTGGKHHRVWIAFEPNQIKSSDNQGTFDPDDERMTYAAGGQSPELYRKSVLRYMRDEYPEYYARKYKPSPGQLGLFDTPQHQVGDTKTENGTTYRLNQNHRWELADKEEPQAKVVQQPSDGQASRETVSQLSPESETHDSAEQVDPSADWKQNGFRAQSFKSWFGDWEIDPPNASKVIDPESGDPQENYHMSQVKGEDGKPVQVYHGTPSGGWDRFDKAKLSKADDLLYGPGFYFTEDETIATEYSDNRPTVDYHPKDWAPIESQILSLLPPDYKLQEKPRTGDGFNDGAELNLIYKTGQAAHKNVRLAHESTASPGKWTLNQVTIEDDLPMRDEAVMQPLHDYLKGLMPQKEVKNVYLNIRNPLDIDGKLSASEASRIADVMESGKWETKQGSFGTVRETVDYLREDHGGHAVSFAYTELVRFFGGKDRAAEMLQAAGYDGITHIGGNIMGGGHEHRVWIAFEPNQIKSADNSGTFDPADDRMKYAEGIETSHQPGETKSRNGVTYVLNQNHRWERQQQETSPARRAGQTVAKGTIRLLNAVNAAPAFASAVAKEAGASPSVARMAYAAATVMDWTTPGVPAGSTAVIALSSLKNPKAAYNVARKAYDKMKSAAVPAKSAKTGVEESMRRALKGAHATRQPEAWMIAYFAALDKGATRESAMQFATAYTGENLHNAAVQRYMKEHSYDC